MSDPHGVRTAGLAAMIVGLMAASVACADGLGFVTLEKASYGPYGMPIVLLVNSAGEWNQAMAKLANDGALAIVPGPDAPADIDWSKECVVLVATGSTGYEPSISLTTLGQGNLKLAADYTPAPNSGGEDLPYHLAKLNKHLWLQSILAVGQDALSALPLTGPIFDLTSPVQSVTWGGLKASYR